LFILGLTCSAVHGRAGHRSALLCILGLTCMAAQRSARHCILGLTCMAWQGSAMQCMALHGIVSLVYFYPWFDAHGTAMQRIALLWFTGQVVHITMFTFIS